MFDSPYIFLPETKAAQGTIVSFSIGAEAAQGTIVSISTEIEVT
jgi:hypothetical protein